jgi:hypothetical protein
MSRISTDVVARVVQEASTKMSDPNYSAVLVGGFVQTQGPTAEYIKAHSVELGGPEGVINAIFHAALMALCFQKGNNRTVRKMTFEELDHVAGPDRETTLKAQQPAIHEYIEANVEAPAMRNVLQLIALAMDWVS